MSKNSSLTTSIYVLPGLYEKAATALYDALEQYYGESVIFSPKINMIQQNEKAVAVCFGQNDTAIEEAIESCPIVRNCVDKRRDQTGTVVLFSPVKLHEIISEIDTLMDISVRSQTVLLPLGDYVLNEKTRVLSGKKLDDTPLTEKEAGVILYLYEKMQEDSTPIGREELLREVWKYAEGIDTHTIETHIYRLRQKVEKNKTGEARDLILTVEGGYRLDI